ncbi:Bifunctional protein FolD [Mannheimia haemolytica]|uniref:Bifunctional protein FolD n=1 Tax=Mannheimia haemolytica TaxID=75985 RepID=A0A378N9B2_MANHA|nr:Bifunctional protein FolD [Mannheimia haemolytica]
MSEKIAHYLEQGKRNPGLAVIFSGNDPASQVYVGSKRKSCAKLGLRRNLMIYPEETTEAELLSTD